MAKNDPKAKSELAKKLNDEVEVVKLSDGFEEEATGAKGWWAIEEGAKFQGKLLDRVRRHDWDDSDPKTHGYTYIFEASEACVVNVGKDETPEEIEAGTLVMVDEKHELKRLKDYLVDPAGSWLVEIIAIEKIEVKNGRQTMWRLKWGTMPTEAGKARGVKKPARYEAPAAAPSTASAPSLHASPRIE